MLSISAAMANHLRQRRTTLAGMWHVTRPDGEVFGFTSLDVDIVFEGVRYASGVGMAPSAISSKIGLTVDNLEVTSFLNAAAITESDLLGGVWDHSEVRVFQVNYADLSMGRIRLRRGYLGQVTTRDNSYVAEVLGLAVKLNANAGELVSPACAAELGDARCKVDLTEYTAVGTVTAADANNRTFSTDLAAATVRLTADSPGTGAPDLNYFNGGVLTWLSGSNAGFSMDVRTNDAVVNIGLQSPMTRDVMPGDTFSVVAGCSKSRDGMCIPRFGNVVNFRGFDFLPGLDKLLQIGGQG